MKCMMQQTIATAQYNKLLKIFRELTNVKKTEITKVTQESHKTNKSNNKINFGKLKKEDLHHFNVKFKCHIANFIISESEGN